MAKDSRPEMSNDEYLDKVLKTGYKRRGPKYKGITDPSKPVKKRGQEEDLLQIAIIKLWDWSYPKLWRRLFMINNDSAYTIQKGAENKAKGIRPGVADLMLMVASRGYHGVFIELKPPKGVQSDTQKEFAIECKQEGYLYLLLDPKSKSKEEIVSKADEFFKWYMKDESY